MNSYIGIYALFCIAQVFIGPGFCEQVDGSGIVCEQYPDVNLSVMVLVLQGPLSKSGYCGTQRSAGPHRTRTYARCCNIETAYGDIGSNFYIMHDRERSHDIAIDNSLALRVPSLTL